MTILHVHIVWYARRYCMPLENFLYDQPGLEPVTLGMVMLITHGSITLAIGAYQG